MHNDPGLAVASGATAITFWAWGEAGGETLKVGVGYAADGFEKTTDPIVPTTTPTEYTPTLGGVTCTDIAGGFSRLAELDAAVTSYGDSIMMRAAPPGAGCTDAAGAKTSLWDDVMLLPAQ